MTDEVEYEVDARTFRRLVAFGEVERATVRYESAFGGAQTVEDDVQHNERVLEPDTATVGNREIDGQRVLSADTGRTVGEVVEIRVVTDKETAVSELTKHWNGYDVDEALNETYVQYWENEHTGETTLTHV